MLQDLQAAANPQQLDVVSEGVVAEAEPSVPPTSLLLMCTTTPTAAAQARKLNTGQDCAGKHK